ncbi:EAL domain-containing protein [Thiorhodococcus mannitoliphagus]|uniref:cyclic-guanylate-specific phosphodiesterase n=1 Tax=Thiorhodococcus mannitoliphagus TaxID=329406 RepID=A0A6P1DZM8_9GAMM|nr:EAL domain-containing protein [Thiorhodococcus mannitoliphagus]NEX21622.1 EAL domain-containing protein [Thiorhodococcus mannitoliphagus]
MRRRRSFFQLFLLATAILVVLLLFARTQVLDNDAYFGWSRDLLAVKELEAQLDRDLLRVSAFLLTQYDPLTDVQEKLEPLGRRFRDPGAGRYGSTTDGIDEAIDAYWRSLGRKQALVERIKLQAALLRNGLSYLPLAVEELAASGTPTAGTVLTLLNRLYLLNLFPSESDERAIRETLSRLDARIAEQGPDAAMLQNTVSHMRANLAGLLELRRLRDDYLAMPSGERFERLQTLYTAHRASAAHRAEQFSRILFVLTLLLLLGLALVLRHLEQTRALAVRERNRLRDAVESLGEAFALFDSRGRLLLSNRRFADFYLWLAKSLEPGVAHAQLERETLERLQRVPAAGATGASATSQTYFEHLEDGRWYLASDSKTAEGGMACVRFDITEAKRRELELRKLSLVLEQSPASVMITDTQGSIEYVNPRFEEVTGYRADEVLGRKPSFLKSGDTSEEEYRDLWETLSAGREWRGHFHNRRKDGSIFWESASISPVRDEAGRVTHFVAVKEDVTARKRAEDQLRMNATVFETTADAIMVTDADNRIKTVNPAFTRMTGYAPEDVLCKDPRILSSGRHNARFYRRLWERLLGQGSWSGEIWARRRDGSVFPALTSVVATKDDCGRVMEFVAVFSDMTQRKSDEQQIRYQANHDALTGLPNRALLQDRLELAIAAAQRAQRALAVLFVDLDRFKSVNETFGHVNGDQLLQKVTRRLDACVRQADTLARFGGDAFVILLPEVGSGAEVATVADKIIARIGQPFHLADREVYVGASIGIALYPEDAETADAMLLHADMATTRAKEAGRNRYQFFTIGMQRSVRAKAELEHELRRAIDRQELVLHYQPVVDAATRRPVHYEALARWHHPTHGMVSPDRFIPLAEETGLIEPLGRWVLETACRQLSAWQRMGWSHLGLAVNVSARQLELGFTAADVESILAASDVAATSLVLEITEGLMLDGRAEFCTRLQELRDLGVRLAVDDFGTGYSSLGYLKRFPVDELKIDRSFVQGLPDSSDDVSLVEAIIGMARSLGLELVAEGVEDERQLAFLRQRGCGLLQGYLLGRPASGEAVSELLACSLDSSSPDLDSALHP